MTTSNAASRVRMGKLVISESAREVLTLHDVLDGLLKHLTGDWGHVSDEVGRLNRLAVNNGQRVRSAYFSGSGTEYWVTTEANRSITTVSLPEY